MKVSVIVPSKGCKYLGYLVRGLGDQSIKPSELILVIKNCDRNYVEKLCGDLSLSCSIIEQREGYFTHALNLGKKEASGDILIFTDDDAIPPSGWIKRYIRLHRYYPNIAGICSREIYLDLKNFKLLPTPDDKIKVKLYKWFVRSFSKRPLPLLKKYETGKYLTKDLEIAYGPCIPNRTCYSLLFKGVNMSFKTNYVQDIWFPEHKFLKRALGNEQHFALQLFLKGFDSIYVPNNPVLHIDRDDSLSRSKNVEELLRELDVMRLLYKELLEKHGVKITRTIKSYSSYYSGGK